MLRAPTISWRAFILPQVTRWSPFRLRRPTRSRCCASTPTGTNRLPMNWRIYTPGLVRRGVPIIDGCGHFRGVREAVDEFLARQRERHLVQRIDYAGRLLTKA